MYKTRGGRTSKRDKLRQEARVIGRKEKKKERNTVKGFKFAVLKFRGFLDEDISRWF